MNKIRPIAIYLPQFHPIPENDEWWGKGFTEWTNVVKGKPRFKGHYQPHLPADLGFYDLRLPEVRQAQADMAKKYGIYGFCYYHYWFNGKRLLERPFEEVFQSGKPDFPFMLCWANENWTRAWDGTDREILIKQEYSEADDIKHINSLIPYFKDERYIKVNGKPVFAIYKDAIFPNIKKTLQIFRSEALKHGIELYLCRMERNGETLSINPHTLGFDAGIEFQPFSPSLNEYMKKFNYGYRKYLYLKNYINYLRISILKMSAVHDTIIDYDEFINFDLKQPIPNYKLYPCVSPGWDNSSRRRKTNAFILKNNTPQLFKKWIERKLIQFEPFEKEENLFFINAWNEWAEGNHLEPCEKWGNQYLEVLKSIFKE